MAVLLSEALGIKRWSHSNFLASTVAGWAHVKTFGLCLTYCCVVSALGPYDVRDVVCYPGLGLGSHNHNIEYPRHRGMV